MDQQAIDLLNAFKTATTEDSKKKLLDELKEVVINSRQGELIPSRCQDICNLVGDKNAAVRIKLVNEFVFVQIVIQNAIAVRVESE